MYGYDTSYLRDMLDADVKAVMALWKAQGMSRYRKDVPRESWYAAALVGALAEDCGPCTQLGKSLARLLAAAPKLRRLYRSPVRCRHEGHGVALQGRGPPPGSLLTRSRHWDWSG
jgi:hypothetical protein